MIQFALLMMAITFFGCGDDKKEPDPNPLLKGVVLDAITNTPMTGANVVVIDLESNETVGRQLTDDDGTFSFSLEEGTYTLEVQAIGYYDYPANQGGGVVVTLPADSSTLLRLNPNASLGSVGSVSGKVHLESGSAAGTLVVAVNGDKAVSTAAGPDGTFLLLNVPAGTWTLEFYKAGLAQTGTVAEVQVSAGKSTSVDAQMETHAGARVTGNVSFLSTTAKNVDVTMVHPITRKAIPGLSVRTDSSNRFQMDQVPPGTYIAWASYQNDSIVMDPDWIRKSGLPILVVLPTDTALTIDFSCTGSILLSAPTNPMDSIYPVEVDTIPSFSWVKLSSYASAQEYIIEVFNVDGKRIWGGYSDSLKPLHATIEATTTTSIQWNFDSSATETLKPGDYRWKIYAIKVIDKKGVITRELLSASEDLQGLFHVLEAE